MSRVSAKQKKEVIRRAQGRCEYCRSPVDFSTDTFSAEHIVPQSLGGKTDLDNLALSCQGCNNRKYNKIFVWDPIGEELVALYHPRQQVWEQHFTWSQDLLHIVGITPTGRATVEVLQLNRRGVVNLRRLLYAAGEHPPISEG